MRTLLLTAAIVSLAGCTSPSKRATANAMVAAPPSVGATTARSPNPYPGYKPRRKGGATVYCKKLSRLGTRFEDEYCLTAAQLDQLEKKAGEDREQFRRNQTMCGAGICGDDK